ncbi:hypothetical protein [Streptomyces sp. NRRL B-1347]|uniref:hypothetical protein n=1 Tax=Streptomyces sp. NRRL B-1347 TaxID=1476877 RepID=UPI000B2533BE|nr:hypothetical protein [Streptomyces sp. NRRL B-1347]
MTVGKVLAGACAAAPALNRRWPNHRERVEDALPRGLDQQRGQPVVWSKDADI